MYEFIQDINKKFSLDISNFCELHEWSINKREEFWSALFTEIEGWSTDDMNDNEKKVFNAIRTLLNSVDQIEIFNKKAIYLYLRELTGMNTKQVVSQLNKIRKKYRYFKHDWDNSKI